MRGLTRGTVLANENVEFERIAEWAQALQRLPPCCSVDPSCTSSTLPEVPVHSLVLLWSLVRRLDVSVWPSWARLEFFLISQPYRTSFSSFQGSLNISSNTFYSIPFYNFRHRTSYLTYLVSRASRASYLACLSSKVWIVWIVWWKKGAAWEPGWLILGSHCNVRLSMHRMACLFPIRKLAIPIQTKAGRWVIDSPL